MNADRESLSWCVCTPWPARGAIASIQIRGDSAALESLTQSLGAGTLPVGQVAVRSVAAVDRCVLARFDPHSLFIFPHAGKRILELIGQALHSRGVTQVQSRHALHTYPEASDELEARMLAALAKAASPLATDLLLDQPRRWQHRGAAQLDETTHHQLSHLIHPPLVVAIGRPNVGKSSLLNALAGRHVSIVADQPGTTRDHVGAMLDLGGLVVRWVDSPGIRDAESDPLQIESQRLALTAARTADLLVLCGDAASGFLPARTLPDGPARVWLALRADLGLPAGWPIGQPSAATSTRSPQGLQDVVNLIRDALVPPHALTDPRCWRFWDLQPTDSVSM